MKRIIRLTESDLHRIIKESVNRVLREGQYDDIWNEYPKMRTPEDDAMDIELDRNLNIDNSNWGSSYVADDPMHRMVHGSTLRDTLNTDTTGNNLDYDHPSQNQDEVVR